MAGMLNIERINENDSIESKVSKLNSNFQSLMNAALILDRTGILSKKAYKQSATAIEKLDYAVSVNSDKIESIENSLSGVDVGVLAQTVSQLQIDVSAVATELTRAQMDELWGYNDDNSEQLSL